MLILLSKIFIYTFLFFLKEVKNFLISLRELIFFFYRCNTLDYLKFIKNKDINFFRNIFFKKFTKKNKMFWKKIHKENLTKKNQENSLLISYFVHTPGYYMTNAIIGKYLCKIKNLKPICLIDENDTFGEVFLRSYGYNNFIYIPKNNFFIRYIYFIKTIIFLKDIIDIKSFIKLKINKIKIGLITYEHFLRHSGYGTINKINFKLIYHFAQSLRVNNFVDNIFKKKKIKSTLQSENQFIPCAFIFQNSLKHNIKVFSREGGPQWCNVKMYKNLSKIFVGSNSIEKKLYFKLFIKHRSKISKIGSDIVRKRFRGIDKENSVLFNVEENKKNNLINVSRKVLCKKFNLDEKKPIVYIFSNCLIDGNFVSGWRLFKDNLTCLKFNLDQATKIKNVNWIVKPHPLESRYPNAKTNTYKEFRKYNKFSNIKLMDGNFSGMTIAKSAKAIVSCFGTAPLEYASYGIPSIIAANARYSHLNIAINPKTIRKYKKYLNSIKYLKKLSKIQIDKANAQTFFQAKFIRVKLNLLPKFDGMAKFNEYSDSFWKDSIKNIENYKIKSDYFDRMLRHQLKKNNENILNLKLLKKM